MSEAKLPPGPWRAVREGGRTPNSLIRFEDADGAIALRVFEFDSPLAVLRAVEALPALVEAARRVVDTRGSEHVAYVALRDALARIDGAGDDMP